MTELREKLNNIVEDYNACKVLAQSIGSSEVYEGTTAIAEDIREGRTAYSNGKLIEGTMPDNNAKLTESLVAGDGQSTYLHQMIVRFPDNVTLSGTSAKNLFRGCKNLLEIPILDTSTITNMDFMCSSCALVKEIPEMNVDNVTTISNGFSSCESVEKMPSFNFQNVIDGRYLFARCYKLKTIGKVNLPKATNLECLFLDCRTLTELPDLTTGAVTNAYGMFYKCAGLAGDIVLNCDLSNATDVKYLFNGCSNIKTISLPPMPKANSFEVMLYGCSKLERILSIDPSNITSANDMVTGCTSLTDEGLNDVLEMCIKAVKITRANLKKLSTIGLTQEQVERCKTLPNYQACIDARLGNRILGGVTDVRIKRIINKHIRRKKKKNYT